MPINIRPGAEGRYKAALGDLTAQLANGDWTHFSAQDFASVHGISASMLTALCKRGIIEVRPRQYRTGHNTRGREYRRTAALANVTPRVALSLTNQYALAMENLRKLKAGPTAFSLPLPEPAVDAAVVPAPAPSAGAVEGTPPTFLLRALAVVTGPEGDEGMGWIDLPVAIRTVADAIAHVQATILSISPPANGTVTAHIMTLAASVEQQISSTVKTYA